MKKNQSLKVLLVTGICFLFGKIALAVTSNVYLAEVFWSTDEKVLSESKIDCFYAISFSDNKLFEMKDNQWVDTTPAEKQVFCNISTGNMLRYQKGRWEIVPRTPVYNVKDYGARGDYEPSAFKGSDDTAAIQYVIDKAFWTHHHPAGVVYIPAGRYLITKTLNVTTDNKKSRCGLTIRGDGPTQTILYGSTGGILFDCTGSTQLIFEGFIVHGTHVARPSTVGILIARGNDNNWAIDCSVRDVRMHLMSDPAANNGIGTIGMWCYAAEHHHQENVWLHANLPLVLTYVEKPSGLPATIKSPYVEISKNPPSHEMGLMAEGQCAYIAYDYYRPALYMELCKDVYLESTYMSVRESPNKVPAGNYFHAIEAHNVLRFSYRGMLEVPLECGYVKVVGGINAWDVRTYLGNQEPVNTDAEKFKANVQPIILLSAGQKIPPFIQPGITNSIIQIKSPVPTRFRYAIDVEENALLKNEITFALMNSQFFLETGTTGEFINPKIVVKNCEIAHSWAKLERPHNSSHF